MHEMVKARDDLRDMGLDAWIGEDYDLLVNGQMAEQQFDNAHESADIKRERDYLRYHYGRILQSDAVLLVNLEKKDIANYIGGNGLIEMGQAYVNDKQIFLLGNLPTELPYVDEILAMDPICLHGDLAAIKQYT